MIEIKADTNGEMINCNLNMSVESIGQVEGEIEAIVFCAINYLEKNSDLSKYEILAGFMADVEDNNDTTIVVKEELIHEKSDQGESIPPVKNKK